MDDLRLPRLAHVAFFRSPHAHARIRKLDFAAAKAMPGVIAVVDGRALAKYCKPWVAVLGHLKGIKSPPQHAIAIERACWQGEAVAAVVAETRAQAEDAAEHIEAEWEALPAVVEMEDALAGRRVIHPDLGDNICFKREHDTGGVDAAFAKADLVVEETYDFGRHTGVTLEPRSILADYNAAEHALTVYHSTQAPHMMQDIFSRHLDIPEGNVRVIAKDVGGSFGIKVHVYADEMATAALSVMLRRPVKFVADRLESFLSDIHAREHRAKVRLACTKDGEILAFDLDDLTAIGPYSVYPRTSGIEGNQVVNLTGGPYKHQQYRAKMHVVFTNKNVTCQYRAVGHPIAVALTEGIVDLAASKLGMDPAEFRRRNLIPDDAYPYTFPSGIKFEKLSHHQALDKLLALMDYKRLARRAGGAAQARRAPRHRARRDDRGHQPLARVLRRGRRAHLVAGRRDAALRADRHGDLHGERHRAGPGHGSRVRADRRHRRRRHDRPGARHHRATPATTPYGGGTWASRGAGIGGECVLQSGKELRSRILDVAAAILKTDKAELDVADNEIVSKVSGEPRLELSELGRVAYFRPDTLPMDFQSELMVTRHYTPRGYGFAFTNGMQASLVEVDTETGFVKLLKHWCVEDCGTMINPMLVDEQVRGGIVQGIGAALYEHCLYSPEGQLLNGNLADYLVPMAGEMPDIVVGHVSTPTKHLGARREGRGRSRHRRRAGRGDERDQRRARALRRARDRAAVHARAHAEGARQTLEATPRIELQPPIDANVRKTLLSPNSMGQKILGWELR